MEAILKFNLPDDCNAHCLATNGLKYWNALWEFKEAARQRMKHGEPTAEVIMDLFWACTESIDWNEIS